MSTTIERSDEAIANEENRDPISGAPGAHPIGTGVGAALGGAAAGTMVGTVVGAAMGAIVGGLAGKGVAEAIDPTRELAYWRDNYKTRPYADEATVGLRLWSGVVREVPGPELQRRRLGVIAGLERFARGIDPRLGSCTFCRA